MVHARRQGVTLLLLVALGAVLAALLAVTPRAVAAPGPGGYDAKVRQSDCELLGREYAPGRGCDRTRCEPGAEPFRRTYGAEACALRGQPQGFGYVAYVDVRQCRALGRRWLAEVNYCASLPDRSIDVLYDAPQCEDPASVYVALAERPGYYDECLTPARAQELTSLAIAEGTTLRDQVSARSAVQCAHRPKSVFVDGRCLQDPAAVPSGGGSLVVGDSLTWRGGDELTRLRPDWVIDGEPARPATQLAQRLDAFRALRGQPDGLVVELGTVPSPGFGRGDLQKVLRTLPRSTKVMLVLPHSEVSSNPVRVSPQSRKVGAFYRAVARSRANTCVADWPAYLAGHRGTLQDGVHVKRAAEGRWARWLAKAWGSCR